MVDAESALNNNVILAVSIPQAVSAIAINGETPVNHAEESEVSIPQAVSAIAIAMSARPKNQLLERFNTASGKCYCNR